MCGIAGFINPKQRAVSPGESLRAMTAAVAHRGPDDEGHWIDAEAGVAFGHRRLAIVDLSPAGRQPMVSASGRFRLCFNGEIYNFRELRQTLASSGHTFRGQSDTEVMLAAFEEWGVERAVITFVGMFAFALWDERERLLHLVRDRAGEKPLYYGWAGDVFLFGSELKALRAHDGWVGEIDRDALALFMRYNYIPAPHSIYRGIRKQIPGTILSLKTKGLEVGAAPAEAAYWSAGETARKAAADPFKGADAEAADALDALLRDSVKRQMVADVPLGAFLSGGIDSSTVVALMQAESARPVKTFTIGFSEAEYNEAADAKRVASHLGTEHTELYLQPEDALAVIPKLPAMYDEPFSDSSQIPTFIVSQLARRSVTVCLSGDGGDELFGGYRRYVEGERLWNKIRPFPAPLRRAFAAVIEKTPVGTLNLLFSGLNAKLDSFGGSSSIGNKMHTMAGLLHATSSSDFYRHLVSQWKEPCAVVLDSREAALAPMAAGYARTLTGFAERMMLIDAVSYLSDDILVKVDRASMSVSLENRVPFLDHRVFEFAWRLPMRMKVRDGQGKWLLRQVLKRYLPEKLIERPKMGFSIPLDRWLRAPLRDWAESLLSERRLRDEGFFDPEPIRRMWAEHLSGRRDRQYYVWAVLMFEAWLERGRFPPQLDE
ncbi:MAG TPA: asparagine synthase (glutamine-hydrolyzing) [Pyrinomonadaceae bacterium]|nr:asparagine synthase (glutamine-hydrolyzing) [Pyrinomonadaceae bacterium]